MLASPTQHGSQRHLTTLLGNPACALRQGDQGDQKSTDALRCSQHPENPETLRWSSVVFSRNKRTCVEVGRIVGCLCSSVPTKPPRTPDGTGLSFGPVSFLFSRSIAHLIVSSSSTSRLVLGGTAIAMVVGPVRIRRIVGCVRSHHFRGKSSKKPDKQKESQQLIGARAIGRESKRTREEECERVAVAFGPAAADAAADAAATVCCRRGSYQCAYHR